MITWQKLLLPAVRKSCPTVWQLRQEEKWLKDWKTVILMQNLKKMAREKEQIGGAVETDCEWLSRGTWELSHRVNWDKVVNERQRQTANGCREELGNCQTGWIGTRRSKRDKDGLRMVVARNLETVRQDNLGHGIYTGTVMDCEWLSRGTWKLSDRVTWHTEVKQGQRRTANGCCEELGICQTR